MIKWICFLFLIFFQSFNCSSQTVTNAVSHQEQSSIIISYNLETTSPCKISLFVSTNGGSSWDGPLKMVKGDVGDKINSGEHSITWSVLEEYKELRGDNIKFQVWAESGIIQIGNQVWSTINLEVSTYRNGDAIPQVQDATQWSKLTTGAWCYYENNNENGVTYGKLYNWYAVHDRRGLAPVGYHIPSIAEWETLANYLGAEPGKQLKSTSGWNSEANGTNTSGFLGLPGGVRQDDGTFNTIGDHGSWWSSTKFVNTTAYYCMLFHNSNVFRAPYNQEGGFSVRCIRD